MTTTQTQTDTEQTPEAKISLSRDEAKQLHRLRKQLEFQKTDLTSRLNQIKASIMEVDLLLTGISKVFKSE